MTALYFGEVLANAERSYESRRVTVESPSGPIPISVRRWGF
jgi:hypothetical protein